MVIGLVTLLLIIALLLCIYGIVKAALQYVAVALLLVIISFILEIGNNFVVGGGFHR